ncbi:MAG: serine/threonine-protein phosphatase [Clostridia bacterium]|nr:serine/threonine-protein phosphatase [Clostridia bacterium]
MLKVASLSENGNREINEDSVGVFTSPKGQCFVLCDGLGGHGMGDVASSLVVRKFDECFFSGADFDSLLSNAFESAQQELLVEQFKNHATKKMKTTSVVLLTDYKKIHIGYIGDSRLYAFKNDKVSFRTLDHSIPQMLCESGEIKESEIRFHKDRNVLLRVMGIDWDGQQMYQLLKPKPLKKFQAFLLCSDGFWELIDENLMCETLKQARDVNHWLELMKNIVVTNGADKNMDNFSAIAVWNEKGNRHENM